MNNMDRKKFFSLVGSGILLGAIVSAIPKKIFSGISKNSLKKISISIHPKAVKRTNKV